MTDGWTVGRKIGVTFSLAFAVFLASSLAGYWSTRSVKANLDETVSRTAKRLEYALQAQGLTTSMFFEERSFIVAVMTNDTELFKRATTRLRNEQTEFADALKKIDELARDDADRKTVERIRESIAAWGSLDTEIVAMLGRNQAQEGHRRSDVEGRQIRDALRKDFDTLLASQRASLAKDQDAAATTYFRARIVSLLCFVLAILVAVVASFVVRSMNRSLTEALEDLSSGAHQVVAASGQVSTSAQSLSQGATEQAAALEESSASMEEMASMTRRNAENSKTAAASVAETERLVGTANTALGDLVASMAAIRESSGEVKKIIRTIDDIAFQTNILALNAAVEAARAGDAGMGFAVVADEVRRLAQRSADAAKDTAAMIDASATNAEAGSAKLNAVVGVMTSITASSVHVRDLIAQVSTASLEQTQGIDQVAQAITQMEKVTQTTAATAEESAAASEELNAQAEQTLGIVRRLETMVRSDAGGQATPAVARRSTSVAARVVPLAGQRPRATRAAVDRSALAPTGTDGTF
jgi:methyl-accepting chemotaxis protein